MSGKRVFRGVQRLFPEAFQGLSGNSGPLCILHRAWSLSPSRKGHLLLHRGQQVDESELRPSFAEMAKRAVH